jgi:predicted nucleotidyltransferase
MNYKISSSSFDHPLLKPILEELSSFLSHIEIKFYVIGAVARDIIMQAHGEKPGRATQDLVIAIAISNWKDYKTIENGILKIKGFTKDIKQAQRFIYKENYLLDIIPFGKIMKEDDRIFWPPDESFAMSVLGFSEVDKATQQVIIDEHLTIDVASLAGIFILKIVAWLSRHPEGNKDADDMGFIIMNYLSVNEDRVLKVYNDLYDDEDFNINTSGAKLLGRDMAEILSKNKNTKNKIREILQEEISKEEESRLINQIIETNRNLKYEEVLKCLGNIIAELKK